MSWPQQQIGFKQSRKLCLNLWSLRWLKPNLSLVISFIPIGLWQLKVLLGVGRMNCKMLFLKRARLSELLIFLSRLFHFNTVDGKNKLLKNIFDVEGSNVANIISCSVCCPIGGHYIKEILRELIFSYLKRNNKVFWTTAVVLRIANLILDKFFP